MLSVLRGNQEVKKITLTLYQKLWTLFFRTLCTQICYKKYQVHKRVNTLTAINSRFVRRLRANFRAILQRKNQDKYRSKLMHSLTMIYILHTCERRKASPALQQETSIPWQIIFCSKFHLQTSFLVLCLFIGRFCVGDIAFHPHDHVLCLKMRYKGKPTPKNCSFLKIF